MQPLPPELFVHADWRKATVGLDNHVRLEATITRFRTS